MSPDPLTRKSPNFLLDLGGQPLDVPPQDLQVIGISRLELECPLNSKLMGSPIGVPVDEDRHDRDAPKCCQREWPIASTRQATEERHEEPLLAPCVLIEENHDLASRIKCPNDPDPRSPHRNLIDDPRVPKPQHGSIEHRLAQPAIDDGNRNAQAGDLGAPKLPVPAMRRHDQHPARARLALRRREVFEALDPDPIEQRASMGSAQQHQLSEPPTQMHEDVARPDFEPGAIGLRK